MRQRGPASLSAFPANLPQVGGLGWGIPSPVAATPSGDATDGSSHAAFGEVVPIGARFERETLPALGDTLAGKYEIVRVLGRGGMGVVFEARDLRLERRVAIKMMTPGASRTPELLLRFEREARAVARLVGSHTVRLLDVNVEPPAQPFLVMEYLDGNSLRAELRERGSLPVAEAVAWLIEACDAVAEAHAAGIVHRDLKPSNLFLCRERRRRTLKVLDFGVSKLIDDHDNTLTEPSTPIGTPAYMAPEQVSAGGLPDARSDVWALGVVLYELLTGQSPFLRPNISAVFAAIVVAQTPSLRSVRPDLPVGLERVLARALCKDPARRYPSTLAFAEALAPFAQASLPAPAPAAEAQGANPQAPPDRDAPVNRSRALLAPRSRLVRVGLFGVAIALAGIAGFWLKPAAQAEQALGAHAQAPVVMPSVLWSAVVQARPSVIDEPVAPTLASASTPLPSPGRSHADAAKLEAGGQKGPRGPGANGGAIAPPF
jgi:eukaryotic-like serine/threonine-protein kinase